MEEKPKKSFEHYFYDKNKKETHFKLQRFPPSPLLVSAPKYFHRFRGQSDKNGV